MIPIQITFMLTWQELIIGLAYDPQEHTLILYPFPGISIILEFGSQ